MRDSPIVYCQLIDTQKRGRSAHMARSCQVPVRDWLTSFCSNCHVDGAVRDDTVRRRPVLLRTTSKIREQTAEADLTVCLAARRKQVFSVSGRTCELFFSPTSVPYCPSLPFTRWTSLTETGNQFEILVAGLLHHSFSFPPLAVVVFYMHIQHLAEVYKEIATAITAPYCAFCMCCAQFGVSCSFLLSKIGMRMLFSFLHEWGSKPRKNFATKNYDLKF